MRSSLQKRSKTPTSLKETPSSCVDKAHAGAGKCSKLQVQEEQAQSRAERAARFERALGVCVCEMCCHRILLRTLSLPLP